MPPPERKVKPHPQDGAKIAQNWPLRGFLPSVKAQGSQEGGRRFCLYIEQNWRKRPFEGDCVFLAKEGQGEYKKQNEKEPTKGYVMKKCPFCAEEIMDEAIKCKHCGSMLDSTKGQHASASSTSERSSFSTFGLLGAFIAVVGGIGGCAAAIAGNPVIAILGIVMLIVGASLGAKY
jgi:hypothetical protein